MSDCKPYNTPPSRARPEQQEIQPRSRRSMTRSSKLVCSRCGEESCAAGDLFCNDYLVADIIPRWAYEAREAQERLAWLVAPTDWATDGTLLQAVALVERYVEHLRAGTQR